MTLRRLGAFAYLGANLCLHVFTRHILRRRAGGADAFHDYFVEDRVYSLTPEERAAFPTFMGCIACGYCDAVCPVLIEHGPGRFAGPQALATRLSYSLPDIGFSADAEHCTLCHECEPVCPERVPIERIVRFLQGVSARAFSSSRAAQ